MGFARPLVALLLFARSWGGGAATQRLFADDEPSLAENAKQCMFLYKGLSKYVYALKVREQRQTQVAELGADDPHAGTAGARRLLPRHAACG